MKLYQFILLPIAFFSLICSGWAKSYLAPERPAVSASEAIGLSQLYIDEALADGSAYYVRYANYEYHQTRYEIFWLICFAKPGDGHYFVAVFMDKKVVGGVARDPRAGGGWIIPGEPEGKQPEGVAPQNVKPSVLPPPNASQ